MILFVFLCISCTNKSKRNIVLDEYVVEGNINDDTIYNGEIIFRNKTSKNILFTTTYSNGVKNGVNKEYYQNGSLRSISYYDNNKLLGPLYYFDSLGRLLQERFVFYDIPVGGVSRYINGKLIDYCFYSLDNEILFKINYDSVKNKSVEILQEGFFFYDTYTKDVKGESLYNYRLYLMRPPRYSFVYSLVQIDTKYSVKRVLKKMHSKLLPWAEVNIPVSELNSQNQLAFRLEVYDSINNTSTLMFKKL